MAFWRGFLRGKKKRPKIGGKFLRWLVKFYLNIILSEQNGFMVKNFESGSASRAIAEFCAARFELIGMSGEIFLVIAENFLSAVGVSEGDEGINVSNIVFDFFYKVLSGRFFVGSAERVEINLNSRFEFGATARSRRHSLNFFNQSLFIHENSSFGILVSIITQFFIIIYRV